MIIYIRLELFVNFVYEHIGGTCNTFYYDDGEVSLRYWEGVSVESD